MPKFKFAKLVRDKIVDRQIASGAKPNVRQLNEDEHKHELIKKIIEEAQEIDQATPAEVAAEIADVQQALDDLAKLHGITHNDITAAQSQKNRKNGAFTKGLYIDYVEIDESDPWTSYYRKNSDRYPEIT